MYFMRTVDRLRGNAKVKKTKKKNRQEIYDGKALSIVCYTSFCGGKIKIKFPEPWEQHE